MQSQIHLKFDGEQVTFNNGRVFSPGCEGPFYEGSIQLNRAAEGTYSLQIFGADGLPLYQFSFKVPGEYLLSRTRFKRLPTPDDETDPYRRVLRKVGFSKVSALSVFNAHRRQVDHENISIGYGYIWETDGEMSERTDTIEVGGRFAPRTYRRVLITNGTWAICRGRHGDQPGKIQKVVVWPGCDPAVLERELTRIIKASDQ